MQAQQTCEYKIWYFAGFYGRAEGIRLLLTHAGVSFEENPLTLAEWPNIKPTMPFHSKTLPAIEGKDGSMHGGATRATVRYLALKYGYYPENPMQAQECDMITDYFQDVF